MTLPVLYLVPDLMNPASGIARYGRMVCRALLDEGMPLTVVARVDPLESGADEPEPGMTYWPCDGSVRAFMQRSLAGAFRERPAFLLAGHANFAPLGWLLARLVGARLVSFIYGIDVFQPLSPWRRWALRKSDRIISISRFTAQRAVEVNRAPEQKLRILHNCIDPGFLQPFQATGIEPGLSMLTVGRVSQAEQYKGQDQVIRAMPALLSRFPDLVYHVVGDGTWRPALEELARQLGVAGEVQFHGFVSEEELRHRYSEATLFIMPSRAEGFGFVFLEAMVHGLPVIAGNVDASPEVVMDGETGILVDPTSVESIVAASTRLLSDRGLRRRMGGNGRERVLREFGPGGFKASLLAYLVEPGS
jgi:glycosyltransferase involved in cell wall biosynthesis